MMPLNGVGTELGGMALLIIVAKIVYEMVKERKSKAAATKLADKNGNIGNPTPLARRPGQSSSDLILSILQEHTQQLKNVASIDTCIAREKELKTINEEVVKLRISFARMEEKLKEREN